jgi:hypothetical protein
MTTFKSISDLRKARGGFESLMKEVDKLDNPQKESRDDTRLWKPTVDKAGNGFAVIRFLPPPQGEDLPWAQIWNHGFQGPTGKWYIENSLTTIGQPDPVSEFNSKLWNSGFASDKDVARKQKRKLQYYANILVIKDPAHPENEGKVFLFKFGKKIFEKIKDVMKPQFEDEEPINPFDFWDGANFKLKVRKFEGYPNYDKSEFDSPSPVAKDDDAIEAIWKQQHSLKELLDSSNFKSYADLKKRLEFVLNDAGGRTAATEELEEVERPTPPPSMKETKPKTMRQAVEQEPEDDDDSLSYFAKLASEE